jgi:hypothetical protein
VLYSGYRHSVARYVDDARPLTDALKCLGREISSMEQSKSDYYCMQPPTSMTALWSRMMHGAWGLVHVYWYVRRPDPAVFTGEATERRCRAAACSQQCLCILIYVCTEYVMILLLHEST